MAAMKKPDQQIGFFERLILSYLLVQCCCNEDNQFNKANNTGNDYTENGKDFSDSCEIAFVSEINSFLPQRKTYNSENYRNEYQEKSECFKSIGK